MINHIRKLPRLLYPLSFPPQSKSPSQISWHCPITGVGELLFKQCFCRPLVYSCVAERHRLKCKFKVRGLLYFLPKRSLVGQWMHRSGLHLTIHPRNIGNSYVSICVNAWAVECSGDSPQRSP